jgi:uncharacterized protein YbaA (DUF1428 family)
MHYFDGFIAAVPTATRDEAWKSMIYGGFQTILEA